MVNDEARTRPLYRYFGAHLLPQRDEQERRRVQQRSIVVVLILLYWSYQYGSDPASWFKVKSFVVLLTLAFLIGNVAYGRILVRRPSATLGFQYAYLVLDPVFLVLAVAVDPERLSFLHSLLLIVVIAVGIRYGTRSMWLSWIVAFIAAAALLPFSSYWQRERELAMGLGLMLALVPVFFHTARAPRPSRARNRRRTRPPQRDARGHGSSERVPGQGQPRVAISAPEHRLSTRRLRDAARPWRCRGRRADRADAALFDAAQYATARPADTGKRASRASADPSGAVRGGGAGRGRWKFHTRSGADEAPGADSRAPAGSAVRRWPMARASIRC